VQSDNATEPYRDRLDVGQRLRLPVEELAVLQPHVPVSNSFGQLIDRANKQHTYIHTYSRTHRDRHCFTWSLCFSSVPWRCGRAVR
jgi:hypothetical protein